MPSSPNGRSVLIVDDNRDAADMLAILLRQCAYEVRTAYTPSEAIVSVADFTPEVVLMDIGLSGMDGYRLARRLCERLKRTPLFVAVTGYRDLEERSLAEGFKHHLVKPVIPSVLLGILADFVGRANGI